MACVRLGLQAIYKEVRPQAENHITGNPPLTQRWKKVLESLRPTGIEPEVPWAAPGGLALSTSS